MKREGRPRARLSFWLLPLQFEVYRNLFLHTHSSHMRRTMGAEELQKKLKKKKKPIKNPTKNHSEIETSQLFHTDENQLKVKGEKKMKKSLELRKRTKDKDDQVDQPNVSDEAEVEVRGKKKSNLLRNNKGKNDDIEQMKPKDKEGLDNKMEDGIHEAEEQQKRKSKKKKRRNEKRAELDSKDDEKLGASGLESNNQVEGSEASGEAGLGTNIRKRKAKKARKTENVRQLPSKDEQDVVEKTEDAEDEVYQMSSGDEDSSKGMKKWIMEYKQSRPGVKVLQERIDDFITAHEAREEQAREEREAQAAEGGWTVVVHHKGRKKTTDSESGIAVGSVAQAAILDKMAKKKNKEVGLDFYRFQKREAHRNEIMTLQSKFEQDKKRIQQLRAQRKFRPY